MVEHGPGAWTKEQKTGFVLLLVFALLTVGLGFVQMRNTIYGPFALRAETNGPSTAALGSEEERLQQADTDHDGLSDYDEINLYNTSAYLPDTDSDKKTDSEEISAGKDPNCPEGTICGDETIIATSTLGIYEPGVGTNNPGLQILENYGTALGGANPTGGSNTAINTDITALVNNPAQLRAQLIASGQVTKETLDKIDDATLLKTVQGVLQPTAPVAPTQKTSTATTTVPSSNPSTR